MALKYLKNVTTLRLNTDSCSGCSRCLQVCPHNVFVMQNNTVRIRDRDACMECGACQKNCPTDAISVQSGVGCAYAILWGMLKGEEPECDCGCSAEN